MLISLKKVLSIHPRFSRTSCINCQNIGFTTGQVQGTYCLKNPRNLRTKLLWTVWMDYIGMRDCDFQGNISTPSLSLSPGISILYVIHSLEGHLSFCPHNAKCAILLIWVNCNKIFDQAVFFPEIRPFWEEGFLLPSCLWFNLIFNSYIP